MAFGNALLDALPAPAGAVAFEHVEFVDLDPGEVVSAGSVIDQVIFPVSAVVSTFATTDGDEMVELAMVGSEGCVGVVTLFGSDRLEADRVARCQVPGAAWLLERRCLIEMVEDDAEIRAAFHRYARFHELIVAQQAVCNLLHSVDERLSRWLLTMMDRAGSDELSVTQDFVAETLVVRRASINGAIRDLQQAGLIVSGRSRISVLDRAGLADRACSCYMRLRDHSFTVA